MDVAIIAKMNKLLDMKKLKVHTYKGGELRKREEIHYSNSFVYSEISFLERELYSGHYGVKLPIKGKELYVLNNQAYEVRGRDYLLTNPGARTEIQVHSDEPVIGICIGLTESFMNDLIMSMCQNADDILDQNEVNAQGFGVLSHIYSLQVENPLSKFLNNIKQNWHSYGHLDFVDQDHFYFELGELILQDQLSIQSKMKQLGQTKFSTRAEIFRRVDVMDQYIRDNFTTDITIESLAQIACMSKYHAIRCYQKIFGVAPYQKIMSLRIEKSKSLLQQGYSVAQTALLSGFSDYRSFSKLFKKRTGTTPSRFQLNN